MKRVMIGIIGIMIFGLIAQKIINIGPLVAVAADSQPTPAKSTFVGLLKYSQVEAPGGLSQLLGDPKAKMMLNVYKLEIAAGTKPTAHQLFAANDKVEAQFKTLNGKTVQVVGTLDPKDGAIRNISEVKDAPQK